jgi:hypothetical protein
MWYIFDWKGPNIAIANASKTVFAKFQKAQSIHGGFSYWKMKDDDKKVHSTIGNQFWIFHRAFANPCKM